MIHFRGYCHEYLEMPKHLPWPILNDVCIRHNSAPHASAGEDSNQRNLRMLTAQWAEAPDSRTAFYLANTHKDAGRWDEAAEWYRKRIGFGEGFRDECLFARLYLIRSLKNAKRYDEAEAEAQAAIAIDPGWAEFHMERAFAFYQQERYADAIEAARPALTLNPAETVLWREYSAYRDQAPRLISWANEMLGNPGTALAWAELAAEKIGAPDADWDLRTKRLRAQLIGAGQAPAVLKGVKPRICLCRPGAIGDVLMTLNLIPLLKEANPDAEIWYFCHPSIGAPNALGSIMLEAGVDQVLDSASYEQWAKRADEAVSLVGYPLAEGYPEKPMRRHLLSYFAEELGLLHRMPFENALPALTLPRPQSTISYPYATIQTEAGWSKYKQWPLDRWTALIDAFPDIRFVQLGGSEAKPLRNANVSYLGAPLSRSIALLANARIHVGIDSWANHASNYFWQDERGNGRRTRAVILWGSTQWKAAGYAQNTNISLDLPCQPCFRENPAISRMPRGPCINPARASYDDDTPTACMGGIGVERVVDAVRAAWEASAA